MDFMILEPFKFLLKVEVMTRLQLLSNHTISLKLLEMKAESDEMEPFQRITLGLYQTIAKTDKK